MAKKRQQPDPDERPSAADYYKLKTDAVRDLATADEQNSPEVSREELKKYKADRGKGIPNGLKITFIKFWFPAAVCYFFFWGLSLYVPNMLDLLFITGIALGVVTDILTNNVLRFMAETEGSNDAWMMFPKKKFYTFFANILYAFVLLTLVYFIYVGLNRALIALTGAPENAVPLGVEPILFGVFYVLCDTALVAVKNFCVKRLRAAKNKNG